MTELKSIRETAVICIVRARQWGATEKDRDAEAELASTHGVDPQVYNVSRSLVDRHHLEAIDRQVGRIRKYVIVNSRPWTDHNGRLVPNQMVPSFVVGLQELIDVFDDLADQFEIDLPAIYAASELVRAGEVNVADLLTPAQARARFSVELRIRPIPGGGDFRVDMSEALMTAIRQDCEDNLQEAAQAATLDSFGRVREVVTTMLAGLERHGVKVPGAKRAQYLTEASVENVSDLVGVLDALNIAQDPDLTNIISHMRSELTVFSADMLKDDPLLRETVAGTAKKVLADVDRATGDLGGFFGGEA